ncbi:MAG: TIGR03067 domain-containing protein [Alphaproteobacteria bacterium]|nr:TIGR03067 domain-containing protein [Alphaproteobacteria bacterium]
MARWAKVARGLGVALTASAAEATGTAAADSKLEGTWLAHGATIAGEAVPKIVGQRLSLTGGRFRITKEGELLYGGSFSVDASAEPPTIRFDQNETETLAGIWLGIYERVGDTLTVCDNAPDMAKPRPKSFGDCDAAGYVLIHFTRHS